MSALGLLAGLLLAAGTPPRAPARQGAFADRVLVGGRIITVDAADSVSFGFDDSSLMNFTDPPLTTVRQPIEAMGRMVVELLLAQIGGRAVNLGEVVLASLLKTRSRVREALPQFALGVLGDASA